MGRWAGGRVGGWAGGRVGVRANGRAGRCVFYDIPPKNLPFA